MRVVNVVGGFFLLGAGTVMLVTPGPGWVAIFAGLALLAREFEWAKGLLERSKRVVRKVKDRKIT